MKIKAVSEYECAYASNECEIPAMKIERDGTCRMIYASTQCCSQKELNRIVIVLHFGQYDTHGNSDGPTLTLRNFKKCVNQNNDLIQKILEDWGQPYVNFQGNYECDLTKEAELALRQLEFRVYYYHNGVSPEIPSFYRNLLKNT